MGLLLEALRAFAVVVLYRGFKPRFSSYDNWNWILSDADIEATASQVSAKKQKAKIEQDSSDSGGEAITILNGVTQISKKARKKKKSAVKVKNLKQIERERVSDFDSSIMSSSFTLLYIIFLSLDQPHSKLEQYKCKRERCPRSDRRLCPVKDQDHVG